MKAPPSPARAPGAAPSSATPLSLGLQAFRAGRLAEARKYLLQVLRQGPETVDALHLMGLIAARQGRMTEAEGWLRRCLAAAPAYAVAHDNLGNTLKAQGRLLEAEACHREAVRLAPYYGPAWFNLGQCLRAQGRDQEAQAALSRARQSPRDYQGAQFVARQQVCDWRQWDARLSELVKRIRYGDGAAIQPFYALSLPGLTSADLLRVARAYGEQYREWQARGPLCAQGDPPPHERLRIGYLSGDLRDHATARLSVGVFELHDRRRFEVFAYSLAPLEDSPMGQRLGLAFEHLTEVHHLPAGQAAARIRADEIDILVDMHGYSRLAQPEILAQRPAPLQVSWLAFAGSMGVPFIDYLLVDDTVVPPAEAKDYDEALAYLPVCYQPQDHRRQAAPPPGREQLGLPEGAFVFCCFNRPNKITPKVFDCWCDLLRDLPQSVLWLFDPQDQARENLRREAVARGITPERLVFAGHVPQEQHLARLPLADLVLDTSPYNAHTTCSDALWAGVPLVTCPGQTFPSRVAASLLQAAGLPELIARDWHDYAAIARQLATDSRAYFDMRRLLAECREQAPLFDTLGYTRALEAIYTRVWSRLRAGLPPGTLPSRVESTAL